MIVFETGGVGDDSVETDEMGAIGTADASVESGGVAGGTRNDAKGADTVCEQVGVFAFEIGGVGDDCVETDEMGAIGTADASAGSGGVAEATGHDTEGPDTMYERAGVFAFEIRGGGGDGARLCSLTLLPALHPRGR